MTTRLYTYICVLYKSLARLLGMYIRCVMHVYLRSIFHALSLRVYYMHIIVMQTGKHGNRMEFYFRKIF